MKAIMKHIIYLMILLCIGVSPMLLADNGYAVIVNAQNDYSGDPQGVRNLLKRLYLKQLTAWPNGEAATVYAAPGDSAEMQAFRTQVLDMTEAEIADFWLNLKQRTGETPPREMRSASTLFKLVEKYPGAYGIVPVDALGSNPEGVKILFRMGAQ